MRGSTLAIIGRICDEGLVVSENWFVYWAHTVLLGRRCIAGQSQRTWLRSQARIITSTNIYPFSAESALNDYLAAVIIGVIEGLTEFLPVSSTAHIRITQELLALPLDSDYWKMFAIVIQLGAILSVIVYFSQRLVGFHSNFSSRQVRQSPLVESPALVSHHQLRGNGYSVFVHG